MNITILGQGAFGSALGAILTANQHTITYYDPKNPSPSLSAALQSAEIVVVAVPSAAIGPLMRDLTNSSALQPFIIATKGLTDLSIFGTLRISYLSGPAFAVDLDAKKPITLTATNPIAQQLFSTPWLTIELTDDTQGVMLCGSLKNIYAIGAGMLSNPPMYIDRALLEMKQYLSDHQASPATADLACGIGDLTLTCSSLDNSRNYRFGAEFAKNPAHQSDQTVEGLTVLGLIDHAPYPILNTIHAIIIGQAPTTTLQELITP